MNKKINNKREIEKIKKIVVPILKQHKVKRAGIFGSYARGEQKKDSDVDILIEIENISLLDFVGIKLDLEEAIRKKVDLVEYRAIKPLIKKYILDDEVKIL